MEQPISALMPAQLVTARPDDTADVLAGLLRTHQVSCLPVVEDTGKVLGIVTDTDMVKLEAARRDPATVHAWEICSYQPLEVAPDTPVGEVARMMVERRIHHVIVSDNKDIRGVVSALDFVRQLVPRESG